MTVRDNWSTLSSLTLRGIRNINATDISAVNRTAENCISLICTAKIQKKYCLISRIKTPFFVNQDTPLQIKTNRYAHALYFCARLK